MIFCFAGFIAGILSGCPYLNIINILIYPYIWFIFIILNKNKKVKSIHTFIYTFTAIGSYIGLRKIISFYYKNEYATITEYFIDIFNKNYNNTLIVDMIENNSILYEFSVVFSIMLIINFIIQKFNHTGRVEENKNP